MIRATFAVIITAGLMWAGVAGSAPAPAGPQVCPADVPVSRDGTCGLSWDDIREQPTYTGVTT